MSQEAVQVKQESEWDIAGSCGVSEASAQAGLHASHVVKNGVVIGPECLQPLITFTERTSSALDQSHIGSIEFDHTYAKTKCSSVEACQSKPSRQVDHNYHKTLSIRLDSPTTVQHQPPAEHTGSRSLDATVAGQTQSEQLKLNMESETFSKNNPSIQHNLVNTKESKCEDSLSCKVCGKQFATRRTLRVHLRTHNKERRYACDICGKAYTVNLYLQQHLKSHTDDKAFLCELCDKRFWRLDHLKSHILTHTAERPYQCDVCQKRFPNLYALRYHNNIHTGDKPYRCAVCGKTFKHPNTLSAHKTMHSENKPYCCEICKTQFARISNLKKHVRCHTGEKPHVCEMCGMQFTAARVLKKHFDKVHMAKRPYKCDVCVKDQLLSAGQTHKRISLGEQLMCDHCKNRVYEINVLVANKV